MIGELDLILDYLYNLVEDAVSSSMVYTGFCQQNRALEPALRQSGWQQEERFSYLTQEGVIVLPRHCIIYSNFTPSKSGQEQASCGKTKASAI